MQKKNAELRVNALRVALRKVLKYWFLFGLAFIVILAGLLCYHMISSSKNVSVTMSFNYEQASSGLNPNGTRFNISEFKSDEVMEAAICYAGLQGTISPRQLANAVSVKNGGSSRAGTSNYINTTYTITLGDIDLGGKVSRQNMLNFICRAYKEQFMALYADNQTILDYSLQSLESEEFLTRVRILEIYAQQLNRYVSSRQSENSSFYSDAVGESFGSLQKKLQYFIDYELEEIRNYILDYGITTDSESMLSRLDFSNRMLKIDYDKAMAHYTMGNLGISLYETMMGSVIMIPTRDLSNQYYMSRTKTEMDYLSAEADSYLSSATRILKEIKYNEYVMGLVANASDNSLQVLKANMNLNSMKDYLDSLSVLVRRLDTAYGLYKAKSYISISEVSQSLKDRANAKTSLVEAVVVLVLIIAAVYTQTYRKMIDQKMSLLRIRREENV